MILSIGLLCCSWLIFVCVWIDLWIGKSRMLKSPIITLLKLCVLLDPLTFGLNNQMLDAYTFTIVRSCWIEILAITQCPCLFGQVLCSCILSDVRMVTPAPFCFLWMWQVFSPPFTFSLRVPLLARCCVLRVVNRWILFFRSLLPICVY